MPSQHALPASPVTGSRKEVGRPEILTIQWFQGQLATLAEWVGGTALKLSFLSSASAVSSLSFKSFGGHLKVQWPAALFLKCGCRMAEVPVLALWVLRNERSVGLGAESLGYCFEEIRLSGLLRDRGCIDHIV